MTKQPLRNWKGLLGARLRELRERAHGGKGITQKRAAEVIERSEVYVNRLETHMEDENPTLGMLDKLMGLYECTMGDLFAPLVDRGELNNVRLKEKLDFLLKHRIDATDVAIARNIDAMYDMARRLKKEKG